MYEFMNDFYGSDNRLTTATRQQKLFTDQTSAPWPGVLTVVEMPLAERDTTAPQADRPVPFPIGGTAGGREETPAERLAGDLGRILPVWQEYFRQGYNRTDTVPADADRSGELEAALQLDTAPFVLKAAALERQIAGCFRPAARHYLAALRAMQEQEDAQTSLLPRPLNELSWRLQLAAEALASLLAERKKKVASLADTLTDDVIATMTAQGEESTMDRMIVNRTIRDMLARTGEPEVLAKNWGSVAAAEQLLQLERVSTRIKDAQFAAREVNERLGSLLAVDLPDNAGFLPSAPPAARRALKAMLYNEKNAGDRRIALAGSIEALGQALALTDAFLEKEKKTKTKEAEDISRQSGALNKQQAKIEKRLEKQRQAEKRKEEEHQDAASERPDAGSGFGISFAAQAGDSIRGYGIRAAALAREQTAPAIRRLQAMIKIPTHGGAWSTGVSGVRDLYAIQRSGLATHTLPGFRPQDLPPAVRAQIRVAILTLLEEAGRFRTVMQQLPQLTRQLREAEARSVRLDRFLKSADFHAAALEPEAREHYMKVRTALENADLVRQQQAQARAGLQAALAGIASLTEPDKGNPLRQTINSEVKRILALARDQMPAEKQETARRGAEALKRVLQSGRETLAKAAGRLLETGSGVLDETATGSQKSYKELEQEAFSAEQKARQVRVNLKDMAARLTGRTLHLYSRGGMLARGIAEWAQAEKTVLMEAGLPDAEAERLVREAVTETVREHFRRDTDPNAWLLLKRTAIALDQAAAGTLQWPASPEERLAQAGGFDDYLLRWAGRQLSGGLVRSLLFGVPQLTLSTLTLIPRQAVVLAGSAVRWALGIRQLYKGVRPGEDVPARLRNSQRTQQLRRTLFRQVMAVLPRPLKLGVALVLAGYAVIRGRGNVMQKELVNGLPMEISLNQGWYLVRQSTQAPQLAAVAQTSGDSETDQIIREEAEEVLREIKPEQLREMQNTDPVQLEQWMATMHDAVYRGAPGEEQTEPELTELARLMTEASFPEPTAGERAGDAQDRVTNPSEGRGGRRKRALMENDVGSKNTKLETELQDRIKQLQSLSGKLAADLAAELKANSDNQQPEKGEQGDDNAVRDLYSKKELIASYQSGIQRIQETIKSYEQHLEKIAAEKSLLNTTAQTFHKPAEMPVRAPVGNSGSLTSDKKEESKETDAVGQQSTSVVSIASYIKAENVLSERLKSLRLFKEKLTADLDNAKNKVVQIKKEMESYADEHEAVVIIGDNLVPAKGGALDDDAIRLNNAIYYEKESVASYESGRQRIENTIDDFELRLKEVATEKSLRAPKWVPELQTWQEPVSPESDVNKLTSNQQAKAVENKLKKYKNYASHSLISKASEIMKQENDGRKENINDYRSKYVSIWERNHKSYLKLIYENVEHDYRFGANPEKYVSGARKALEKLIKDRREMEKLLLSGSDTPEEEAIQVALYMLLTYQINMISGYNNYFKELKTSASEIKSWDYFMPVLQEMKTSDNKLGALDRFRIEAVKKYYPWETTGSSDQECLSKYQEIVDDNSGIYSANSEQVELYVRVREYLLYQYLSNDQYFKGRRSVETAINNINVAEFDRFTRKDLEGEAISYVLGASGEGQYTPLAQVKFEAEGVFTTNRQFYKNYRDFIENDAETAGKVTTEKFILANSEIIKDYNVLFLQPQQVETYEFSSDVRTYKNLLDKISSVINPVTLPVTGFIKIITISEDKKYLFSTIGNVPFLAKYNGELEKFLNASPMVRDPEDLSDLVNPLRVLAGGNEKADEILKQLQEVTEVNKKAAYMEYRISKNESASDNQPIGDIVSDYFSNYLTEYAGTLMDAGNQSYIGKAWDLFPFYGVMRRWANDPGYTPTVSDMTWDIADVAVSFGLSGAGLLFNKMGALKKMIASVIKELRVTDEGLSGVAFYSKVMQSLSSKIKDDVNLSMLHSAIDTLALMTADAFNPIGFFQGTYSVAQSSFNYGREWGEMRKGVAKRKNRLGNDPERKPAATEDQYITKKDAIDKNTSEAEEASKAYRNKVTENDKIAYIDELTSEEQEEATRTAINNLPVDFNKDNRFIKLAETPEGQCDKAAEQVVAIMRNNNYDTRIIGCLAYKNTQDIAPLNHYAVLAKKGNDELIIDITFEQFVNKNFRKKQPLITSGKAWAEKIAASNKLNNSYVIAKEYNSLREAKAEIAFTHNRTFIESDFIKDEGFSIINMPVFFVRNLLKQYKSDISTITDPASLATLAEIHNKIADAKKRLKALRKKEGEFTEKLESPPDTLQEEINKLNRHVLDLETLKNTSARISGALTFFNKIPDINLKDIDINTSVSSRLKKFLENITPEDTGHSYGLKTITDNGIAEFADGTYLMSGGSKYPVLLSEETNNKALLKVSDDFGLNIQFNGSRWEIVNETLNSKMMDLMSKLPHPGGVTDAVGNSYSVFRTGMLSQSFYDETKKTYFPAADSAESPENIVNTIKAVGPIAEDLRTVIKASIKNPLTLPLFPQPTNDPEIYAGAEGGLYMRVNDDYVPFTYTKAKETGYLRIGDKVIFVTRHTGQWVSEGASLTLTTSASLQEEMNSGVANNVIAKINDIFAEGMQEENIKGLDKTSDESIYKDASGNNYLKVGNKFFTFRRYNGGSGYLVEGDKAITVVKDNGQWSTANIIPPVTKAADDLKDFVQQEMNNNNYKPYAPVKGDFLRKRGEGIYVDKNGKYKIYIEGNYFSFSYDTIKNKANRNEGVIVINGFPARIALNQQWQWYIPENEKKRIAATRKILIKDNKRP